MAGEVRQALSNLISNAIDAMPTGGSLCVRVSKSHTWDDHKPGVRVTVLNTGSSIPPQARKKDVRTVLHHQGMWAQGLGSGSQRTLLRNNGAGSAAG
ncbi:MAG TPA: sensor histidine kinase [Candidatus Angelobacter sp.]|nr:sensor histidine kinase [Candidatus Angelobacter sp.]